MRPAGKWMAAIAIAPALAIAAALPAQAATVASVDAGGGYSEIVYTAAKGEANRLAVASSGDDFSFTDAGGIAPGPGCHSNGDNRQAICAGATVFKISVTLDDQDDTAKVAFTSGPVPPGTEARASGNAFTGSGFPSVSLDGGDGNDTLDGGQASVFFDGGAGDDTILAGSSFDRISAGDGADHIKDSPQATDAGFVDDIDCGAGADTVSASTRDKIRPSCEAATRSAQDAGDSGPDSGQSDSPGKSDKQGACGLEKAAKEQDGSNLNDTLTGTPGADRLLGLGGVDVLTGLAGNDCLLGGDGNDKVAGGDGDDQIEGGTGDDAVQGDAGNDRIYTGAGKDTATGDAGNDRLFGAGGEDNLAGGEGNDRIFGEGGDDTLDGGDGKDRISAGGGNNKIDGGDGPDAITANNGKKDVIDCGAGVDRVVVDPEDDLSGCERVKKK